MRSHMKFSVLIILFLVGCGGRLKTTIDIDNGYSAELVTLPKLPELVWREKLISPVMDIKIANDSIVIVFTYRGEIFLLNTRSGDIKGNIWQPFREPVAAFNITDNYLYIAASIDEPLIAYDLSNRKRRWRNKRIQVMPASMTIIEDTLYVSNVSQLLALDRLTGSRLYYRNIENTLKNQLLSAHNKLIAFSSDGEIVIYNTSLQVKTKIALNLSLSVKATVAGGLLAVVDGSGQLFIIDLLTNAIVWKRKYESTIFAAPTIHNDRLIIGLSNGTIIVYNLNTGIEEWRYRGLGLINIEPVITDNEYIIPFSRGEIVAVDQKSGKIIWKYATENVIRSMWEVNDGLLFIDQKRYIHLLRGN